MKYILILLAAVIFIGLSGYFVYIKYFKLRKTVLTQQEYTRQYSIPTITPVMFDLSPKNVTENKNSSTYEFEEFKITIPSDWSYINKNKTYKTYAFAADDPKSSALYIGVISQDTYEENIKLVLEAYKGDPKTTSKDIKIGNAVGKEYFGCLGVEGCIHTYTIFAKSATYYYHFQYYFYWDQDTEAHYKAIRDSMFFN